MRWSLMVALSIGLLATCVAAAPAGARPDVTLWVAQSPGELVAFDLADFSRVGGVRLPPAAFADPARVTVNGAGQILARLDDQRLWIWDGRRAGVLDADSLLGRSPATPPGAPQPSRTWLLGDDGSSLFRFETTPVIVAGQRVDSSATHETVDRFDLELKLREHVLDRVLPPCQTSPELVALAEPCPPPDAWTPDLVVRDFFLLTDWLQVVPARYGDDDQDLLEVPVAEPRTTLHRLQGRTWLTDSLPPLETCLDFASTRRTWLKTSPDAGCCGWDNESSDQTMLGRGDSIAVLFDEWPRYHNQDYDVSFFTASACIAPATGSVAFEVHATTGPAAEIRLSSDGKPDSVELAAIRRSLAELPLVEVDDVSGTPRTLLTLPHAELLGWASDSEVLVVERGRIVAIDVVTQHRRESGIGVRSRSDALVVWR